MALAGLCHDVGYPLWFWCKLGHKARLGSAALPSGFDDAILSTAEFADSLICRFLKTGMAIDRPAGWERTQLAGDPDKGGAEGDIPIQVSSTVFAS